MNSDNFIEAMSGALGESFDFEAMHRDRVEVTQKARAAGPILSHLTNCASKAFSAIADAKSFKKKHVKEALALAKRFQALTLVTELVEESKSWPDDDNEMKDAMWDKAFRIEPGSINEVDNAGD